MTIKFVSPGETTIPAVQVFSHSPHAVKALAHAVLRGLAESQVEFVADELSSASKSEIDLAFGSLRDVAVDFLEDTEVFAELGRKVLDYIQKAEIQTWVRSISYNVDGKIEDVAIDLAVS